MKKLAIFASLVIIAGLTTAWLVNNQLSSTLNVDETNFSVENTDDINKIVLTDRNDNKSVLELGDNGKWWLNDAQLVNESRLQTLMETLEKVDVKSPVPNTMRENVIKDLSSRSVKIEIFEDDELSRSYYVGGKTNDQKGTFMVMDGADNPYITHIPGFTGYLSIRYFAEPSEWETPRVFPFDPGNIAKVEVNYPNNPNASYRIEAVDETSYELFRGEDFTRVDEELDVKNIRQMLASAAKFQYEGEVTYKDREQIDSIHSQEPIATISIESFDGNQNMMTIHYKPEDRRTKFIQNPEEELEEHLQGLDLDKRLGFVNNDKGRLVLLQERTLSPMLAIPGNFIKDDMVSKN